MNQKTEKVGVACLLFDGWSWTNIGRPIWLSQRLGEYEHGKYACPGGMVDPTDASDVHAIQRELLEETGINITDLSRFKRIIVSHHPGGKSDITQWFVLELTYWWKETPKDMEPRKHSPWNLYTLEEAKYLPLMVSTKEILEKYEKTRTHCS